MRIVKEHDERYAEFVAAARHLFSSQGYDHTTVQAIIDYVGVAKGTFYHYFGSKQAVLEAVVAHLSSERLALFEAVVEDGSLTAVEKIQRALQASVDWHKTRRKEVIEITRMLTMPENILLAIKLESEKSAMLVPALIKIIEQGIAEGLCDVEYVEEVAEMICALQVSLSVRVLPLMMNAKAGQETEMNVRRKIHAAEAAMERLVGIKPGTLQLLNEEWISAMLTD